MGRARDASLPTPAAPEAPAVEPRLNIAVVGAHLSGMALNRELLALGATLVGEARTAADYRLFVLPDTRPAKPGLVRVPGFAGPGNAIEIWSLDPAAFGRFVEKSPALLRLGTGRLDDDRHITCFLRDASEIAGAAEHTAFAGVRVYIQP